MRFLRRMWAAGALIVLAAATATAVALGGTASGGAKKPIIIGAAVDLTSQMKPFDSAALLAAQLRAQHTKVNGRSMCKFISGFARGDEIRILGQILCRLML